MKHYSLAGCPPLTQPTWLGRSWLSGRPGDKDAAMNPIGVVSFLFLKKEVDFLRVTENRLQKKINCFAICSTPRSRRPLRFRSVHAA